MVKNAFADTADRDEVLSVFEYTTCFGFGGGRNNASESFTFGVKWSIGENGIFGIVGEFIGEVVMTGNTTPGFREDEICGVSFADSNHVTSMVSDSSVWISG